MPYQPNIPLAPTPIRISQNDLLVNFQQILTTFQTNHSPFNGATPGRHVDVSFVEQAVAPVTGANEFSLYAFLSPRTGQTELFTRRANNGASFGITEASATGNGYAMTSSGLLIQWGTAAANGDTTIALVAPNVVYPTIILAAYFTVITAPGVDANRFVELISFPTLGSFRVYSGTRTIINTPAASNFYWTLIGF